MRPVNIEADRTLITQTTGERATHPSARLPCRLDGWPRATLLLVLAGDGPAASPGSSQKAGLRLVALIKVLPLASQPGNRALGCVQLPFLG